MAETYMFPARVRRLLNPCLASETKIYGDTSPGLGMELPTDGFLAVVTA